MAVQFYVEQSDRAYQSGLADEALKAGELVYDDGEGVAAYQYGDGFLDGLLLYDAEFMAAEDEDAISDETLEVGDRAKYAPLEGALIGHVRTVPESNSGVTSAPSIGHGDVVGVVDSTVGDASADMDGRIVEEGYTNDENDDTTSTTFNRSNGNFVAIGEAYRPAKQNGDSVTDYDVPVRVDFYAEPKES